MYKKKAKKPKQGQKSPKKSPYKKKK